MEGFFFFLIWDYYFSNIKLSILSFFIYIEVRWLKLDFFFVFIWRIIVDKNYNEEILELF